MKQVGKSPRYDWYSLARCKKKRQLLYGNCKENTFDTQQVISEKLTPNYEDEKFLNTLREAATKYMSTKSRAKYRITCELIAIRENNITWNKKPKKH